MTLTILTYNTLFVGRDYVLAASVKRYEVISPLETDADPDRYPVVGTGGRRLLRR